LKNNFNKIKNKKNEGQTGKKITEVLIEG